MLILLQVDRPITMKKDGIQTRNRKLAAKVKKRRMQDFLQGPARFGAYGNPMAHGNPAAAGWGNLTNQVSEIVQISFQRDNYFKTKGYTNLDPIFSDNFSW